MKYESSKLAESKGIKGQMKVQSQESSIDPDSFDEHGANLVEYALLALLIMVASILSLHLFSDAASKKFSTISSAIEGI